VVEERPLVVGVSGASGAPIAVRLLEALHDARVPVALVLSKGGQAVLKAESDLEPSSLERWASVSYRDDDLTAPIASGSRPTRGMVVAPCSSTSLAKIALGLGDTLLTRAAFVHLKERRPLLLVPRESPLPTNLLRHMTSLSEMGAVILPPAPPYYLKPKLIGELTDFTVGKVLDHLGIDHQLYRGWRHGEA
jgi:4-hydroxy-3-polyprenylbenzoate decarboxylase